MKLLLFILLFQIVSFASGDNSKLSLQELPKLQNVSLKIERKIPIEYRKLIVTECLKYNIPLEIFVKHIYRESKFNPNAINYNYKKDPITGEVYLISKDEGIGQLNSLYHNEQVELDNNGKEFNPMNPYEAIPVIAHRLYRIYSITANWIITIAEYNCGLTRALKGNFPEVTKRHLAYVFGENYGEIITQGKT
jgi:hypothetical protein